MRILVISPFRPHPRASHGGAVYLGSLLQELREHAEIAVVTFAREGDTQPLPGLREHAVPFLRNDQLSAWDRRRRQLRLAWDWGVGGLPLLAAKHRSAQLRRAIAETCASFRPDVAMVEFAVMAQYLDDVAGLAGVPAVLTDHEHGQAVPPRMGPSLFGIDARARRRDASLWQRYVRTWYPQADRVQALSEADATGLAGLLQRPVGLRPVLVPLPPRPVDPAGARPRLLFLGDYLHHPNPEAAAFLAREVLPRVRAVMPAAELWLCGPRAGADVLALADLPGIRMLGFVHDLAHLMLEVRCMVAPVFSGSGVRIKLLTAAAHGLPVVSNALGLQGTGLPEAAMRRGETAAELAAACLELLQEPAAAAAAGSAARAWAEAHLGAGHAARAQLQALRELSSRPRGDAR